MKGRHSVPFVGRPSRASVAFLSRFPGLAPWAIVLCPFRAKTCSAILCYGWSLNFLNNSKKEVFEVSVLYL